MTELIQQFDLFGDPIVDDIDVPLRPATYDERTAFNPHSYGRRLTERLHALADAGVNPLVGTRGPEGKTCGDCAHRALFGHHDRTYPKCDLGPNTHGVKTDVRRAWPACSRFEPKD